MPPGARRGPRPASLLDRGGRIVAASDRALALLRRRDGLSDRHGALCAASREDDRGLRELLSRALPRFAGPGESDSMTVRTPPLPSRGQPRQHPP
ncbi:MAG: hypothetical protein OXH59_17840 [Rhodospirillaceae bacterium]|nr:hypothetical protein [Rhodospirillaceae bacterium]